MLIHNLTFFHDHILFQFQIGYSFGFSNEVKSRGIGVISTGPNIGTGTDICITFVTCCRSAIVALLLNQNKQ